MAVTPSSKRVSARKDEFKPKIDFKTRDDKNASFNLHACTKFCTIVMPMAMAAPSLDVRNPMVQSTL